MFEPIIAKISDIFGLNEYVFLYQVFGFLGWLNVVLVVIAGSLFGLRRLNKYVYGNKNTTLKKIVKPLSKIHPYIGSVLLISAFIHGDLALGTVFKLHTGPLAGWILLLMMLVALIGKKFRVKNWLKIHRILAVLFVCAILLHLFARNIF
jgi:predicted ferric reductase